MNKFEKLNILVKDHSKNSPMLFVISNGLKENLEKGFKLKSHDEKFIDDCFEIYNKNKIFSLIKFIEEEIDTGMSVSETLMIGESYFKKSIFDYLLEDDKEGYSLNDIKGYLKRVYN